MDTSSSSRRSFSAAVASGIALAASPRIFAQSKWPSKSITCTVAFAPGGGTDFVMRTIGPALSARLGQPFSIDNRPGASGVLAAQHVAQAQADGHTLFGTDGGAVVINAAVFPKLPYDPRRDLVPVAMVIRAPVLILVHPSFPANDLRGMVEIARRDKTFSYASVGQGTYQSLAMELLKRSAKFEALDIPYKGGAPAAQAVIAGQVPVMAQGAVAGIPQVRNGTLKYLAVLTRKRVDAIPNVPTALEQGFDDIDLYPWVGVMAPRGTPSEIVSRLNSEINAATMTPEINKRFKDLGMEPFSISPEAFGNYIENEIARLHPLIRSLNIKLD